MWKTIVQCMRFSSLFWLWICMKITLCELSLNVYYKCFKGKPHENVKKTRSGCSSSDIPISFYDWWKSDVWDRDDPKNEEAALRCGPFTVFAFLLKFHSGKSGQLQFSVQPGDRYRRCTEKLEGDTLQVQQFFPFTLRIMGVPQVRPHQSWSDSIS